MFKFFALVAFVAIFAISAAAARPRRTSPETAQILQSFQKSKIIPDVLKFESSVPMVKMRVKYGKTQVNLGTKFNTTDDVKQEPNISWPANDDLYTLIKVDPDAPSAKDHHLRNYLHWLVVNIRCDDLDTGSVVADYLGAGAPPKTGYHRYVFLAFRQQTYLDPSDMNVGDRTKFNVDKFAGDHLLGRPVAGNFYLCRNKDQ